MKKIFHVAVFGFALFSVFVFANAQSTLSPNASLTLVKSKDTGYFTLTMRDPDGIQKFSLIPPQNLPYGGDIPQCPRERKMENIAHLQDPTDFEPELKAVIFDCKGGETEFSIKKNPAGTFTATKTSSESAPAQESSTRVEKDNKSNVETVAQQGFNFPVSELGNCGSEKECKTYCDDTSHINACLSFAEKHGLLSGEELEKGRKFQTILRSGGGPGGCQSEKSCEAYCSDVSRLDECVSFAEENGFVKGAELEEMKKIHRIVKDGKRLPGNCKNKNACEAYCKNSEHLDECFAFAKENDLMSKEELAEAEKFLPLMKSGQMPGACKSKEECEAYCESETHMDECIDFAAKHGFISPEDLEIVKKTGGKGPGGCKGRACKDFCENPNNQKACFEFAKEHGILKEGDMRRMEEGREHLKKELSNMPENVRSCLENALGAGGIRAIESGEFFGGRDFGEKMKICFEENFPPEFKDKFKVEPGGEFVGPGGCKSHEECETYCRENPEACGMSIPQGGGGFEEGHEGGYEGGMSTPPGAGFSGPGGCASKEECMKFCQENPKECSGFRPPGSSGGGLVPPRPLPLPDEQGAGMDVRCSFTDFNPVCGRDGTTYNNACFAKQKGVEVARAGACDTHTPCEKIYRPVCGVKGGVRQGYYSACVARGDGAEVLYEGECKLEQSLDQIRSTNVCPAMPTVVECPVGQKKVQVFSSPECGTYYSCAQETPGVAPSPYNTPMPPFSPSSEYQKQYELEYQKQYELQYQNQLQNYSPPSSFLGGSSSQHATLFLILLNILR